MPPHRALYKTAPKMTISISLLMDGLTISWFLKVLESMLIAEAHEKAETFRVKGESHTNAPKFRRSAAERINAFHAKHEEMKKSFEEMASSHKWTR